MNLKLIFIFIIGLLSIILIPKASIACEIEMKVIKGNKDSYKKGDTIVVLVDVALTHRSCPVAMKKTKFKLTGLKVIKSTPWKQKSTNDWQRKLMIVVTDTSNGKLNLTAVRECEKDGGFGTLKLEVSE